MIVSGRRGTKAMMKGVCRGIYDQIRFDSRRWSNSGVVSPTKCSDSPGVPSPENLCWFDFPPGRTPIVRVVLAEVSTTKLRSIPNRPNPMVE